MSAWDGRDRMRRSLKSRTVAGAVVGDCRDGIRRSLKSCTVAGVVVGDGQIRFVDFKFGEKSGNLEPRFHAQRSFSSKNPQKFNTVNEVAAARVDDREGGVICVQNPVFSPWLPLGKADLEVGRNG